MFGFYSLCHPSQERIFLTYKYPFLINKKELLFLLTLSRLIVNETIGYLNTTKIIITE